MDLLTLVVQPTWREFLTDLVSTNQMDPWDLDLVEIADKYLEKIRNLHVLDLRIPANVILASALLLRFKADALNFEEEAVEEEFFEERQLIAEDMPELVFRTNRPRNRRVTLDELLNAVEQVMRDGSKRAAVIAPKILSLDIPKRDMDERMKEVYERALALRDAEGILVFSALLHNGHCTLKTSGAPAEGNGHSLEGNGHAKEGNGHSVEGNGRSCEGNGHSCEGNGHSGNGNGGSCECVNAESTVSHLLPVLHLVQDRKMLAWQEAIFGEIFLRVWTDGERAAN